jgi:LAGLIDADG DNA endonuclease family
MTTRKSNLNPELIENAKKLVNIFKGEFRKEYPQNELDITKKPLPIKAPGLPDDLNLSRSEMAQLNLHSSVLSVLCGTLLGDGSLKIQSGYKNARFQYRHSTRQTEWFMWKTLGPLKDLTQESGIQFQNPDGNQRKARPIGGECLGKLKISSSALPVLTSLHKILCKDNQIVIERHWLNHMNAYFLMTLWLDDGSLVGKRQGYFCLYSIPKKELDVLAAYMKNVWDIDCNVQVYDAKKQQFRIAISDQENLYKFLRIIAPLIPIKTMLYKICFYPTDVNLLQRWTAEMKTLIRKEWHEELDKQYLYHAIRLTDSSSVEDIVH